MNHEGGAKVGWHGAELAVRAACATPGWKGPNAT